MLKQRYIYESSNCKSCFTSVQYSHYDPYICGMAVLSLNMLLWYWTVSVLSPYTHGFFDCHVIRIVQVTDLVFEGTKQVAVWTLGTMRGEFSDTLYSCI